MGQRTLDGVDITQLRETYQRRVTVQLPAAAVDHSDWPIQADHCFARVILDNVFEAPWYEHLEGRPAYEQLSVAELREAITLADRMCTEGCPAVQELHENSLRWRGKLE